MKIFKYPIEVKEIQFLELPVKSAILTVQAQRETPSIWALVDEREQRNFRQYTIYTYGTGHVVPDNLPGKYLGTYQLREGHLVFHVFVL